MEKFDNFINGKIQPPAENKYLDVINPAIGKKYAEVANSTQKDVEDAVLAAKEAFPNWSGKNIKERSKILRKLGELISHHKEELYEAETQNTGKPISLTKSVDIPRSAINFKFYADSIINYNSDFHHMDEGAHNFTLRKPLGVVGIISPWNLPLYLLTWKIAPALATGNTVVAKPSELTPHTAFLFSQIMNKAGLPPGVLNIVHGRGESVGEAIVKHPDIKAISFTGGTATGKKITENAAPMLKKISLELGGKNPSLIFADCDFNAAIEGTLKSSFQNQGQICLCSSRILIEKSIYNKFKDQFVLNAKELKIGDPTNEETQIGSLISSSHRNKVQEYIDAVKDQGGHISLGNAKLELSEKNTNGAFVSPTIIEGLDNSCSINQEEIFGPVVSLIPFETEEEALKMANESQYGLSATVWTKDVDRVHRISEKLEAGVIWFNSWMMRDLRTPFGGLKKSGIGREGGKYSLDFFTNPRNVCIKFNKETES